MRMKFPCIFLLSAFMVFWSVSTTAQSHSLPQPQMSDTTKNSDGPPPPGLVVPIDENIYVLVIAGLTLGIYLLRIRKTV